MFSLNYIQFLKGLKMDLKISRNFLIACSGLSLLFLMMAFISQLYAIKIVLMLLLMLLIRKKPYLSNNVKIAYFLIFLYGIYGIFIGFLYQTPNPFVFVTIYCLWPLFYILYTIAIVKEKYFKLIIQTIFVAHVFIVFYDLLYAWGTLIGVPVPNIYAVEIPFSIYDNASRMNFVNLNSLTFSAPVLFILVLGKYDLGISRLFQFFVLICTFFLFIISGRRSVMLIMAVLPFFPFFFSNFFSKKLRHTLVKSSVVFLLLFLGAFIVVDKYNPQFIENYTQVFFNAFDSEKEPVKFAQKKMLIEKFKEKPIFGHGSGEMFFEPSPGRMTYGDQFELSYHFKLASTGVVGFILIIGIYLWILFYGVYLARKRNDLLFLSFLVGYFFMLIADSTNPVLCSFDLIWPIYLCLAKINYLELNKENM